MPSPVYLDYNATTPVDPRVLAAMLPFFSENFGNASSRTHSFGWVAEQAVETAREKVAALVNAEATEIVFTSGSTESINLAIKGVYAAYRKKGNHIITVSTEHKAVLDTCKALGEAGAQVTILPVDREGLVDPALIEKNIRKETILVAVMQANNETGTIQPIEKISAIAHAAGALFLSDTTQAAGKMRLDVQESGIDLCCISAHKIYGPKGAGALYIRRKNPRVTLFPLLHGGGHERGLRSGTLNVTGIVGLGKAAEIARDEWWDDAQRISLLRTELEQQLLDAGNVHINGSIRNRLPNTTNITIRGIKADKLITTLPRLAMATGSACTSALPEPSHVLRAMGLGEADALSSLRISLGRNTTNDETRLAAAGLCNVIRDLRYSSQ